MFDKQIKGAAQDGLPASECLWDLVKKPPRMFENLVEHAIEESEVEDYKKVKTQEKETK